MSARTYFEYTNKRGRKYYYDTEATSTTFRFPQDGIVFDPKTKAVIHVPPGVDLVEAAPDPVIPQSPRSSDTGPSPRSSDAAPPPARAPARVPAKAAKPQPASEEEPVPEPVVFVLSPQAEEESVRETPALESESEPLPDEDSIPEEEPVPVAPPHKAAAQPRKAPPRPAKPAEAPAGVSDGDAAGKGPWLFNGASSPPFSAREFLCLAFNVSFRTQDSGKLPNVLNSTYRLESYAQKNFREHYRGGLFGRGARVPISELITYQTTPIQKPLLKAVPTNLKRHCVLLFELILDFMGLKAGRPQVEALRIILGILREEAKILTDEVYFQLVKQSNGNNNVETGRALWELFSIVASLFPPSDPENAPWILAHVGRAIISNDKKLSKVATFVALRFQTRQYFGVPFNYMAIDKGYPRRIPAESSKGKYCYGVALYEMLWYQHRTYPKLPIPYVLHYIVTLLKERGALAAPGFLRVRGDASLLKDILGLVNKDVTTIGRGNIHVIGAFLKQWLKRLPNPVIPGELIQQFSSLCENNKWHKIVDLLPPVHKNVLFYLIGFLREVAANATAIGLDKSDVATMFGPLIVNPARGGREFPDLIQNLTGFAVAFCERLLDPRLENPVYPLDPALLELGPHAQELPPTPEEAKDQQKAVYPKGYEREEVVQLQTFEDEDGFGIGDDGLDE